MKNIVLVVALMITSLHLSAQKYFTKTGETTFKASVETFEPVAAESKSTTAILNTANGEVAALLFVKTFHFEVALMEEHFNENYMDSDKFPKATFKGKLVDFDMEKLSSNIQGFRLKGVLTIKGKKKEIDTVANLKVENGKIIVDANFDVQPGDFGIDIPSIVRNKIAETVNIELKYELVKR